MPAVITAPEVVLEAPCQQATKVVAVAKQELPVRTQHFINNEYVDSVSAHSTRGSTFDTFDPASEEKIASIQCGTVGDIDRAVEAARKAFFDNNFPDECPGPVRRDMLLRFADLMELHKEQLAKYESMDNGKPPHVALGDVTLAIAVFRYYAGWADKGMCGKTIPGASEDKFAMTIHEPIGVVGCIIPWNFPIVMVAWKWAPLVACGCTSVLKSSEKTPLTVLMLCDLTRQAKWPAGVVNVVCGYGDLGEALVKHPDVAKVCFTGSSAVGHKIVEMAGANNLKKVTLELGGKSSLIVTPEADVEEAAKVAHVGLFLNQGQCCCASSRILVHESVYEKFAQLCVARAKQMKVGQEPDCEQGPQVDKIQYDKILRYIDIGFKEGATCLLGGTGKVPGQPTGFYVQPTIFGNVTDDMTIAREEIFGPVMQLQKYTDINDAIKRANATPYGLAAGICCQDIGKAMGIAKKLQAGTVWINMYDDFDPAVPFGGFKESGWGREKSEYALQNFTEVKCIMFPIAKYNRAGC